MPDNEIKQDNRDRSQSRKDDDEIQDLSEKTGITSAQARQLIKRYGNNRPVLEKHARNLIWRIRGSSAPQTCRLPMRASTSCPVPSGASTSVAGIWRK